VKEKYRLVEYFNDTLRWWQVAVSAGPACASALREVTRLVDEGLASNATKIKAQFGAEQVCFSVLIWLVGQ
jgi:hypothetical protein